MHQFDQMTKLEINEILSRAAAAVQEHLPPDTAMLILAKPLGANTRSRYVSNCTHTTVLEWLRKAGNQSEFCPTDSSAPGAFVIRQSPEHQRNPSMPNDPKADLERYLKAMGSLDEYDLEILVAIEKRYDVYGSTPQEVHRHLESLIRQQSQQ